MAGVTDSFDPVAYNRAAWDGEVESSSEWTQPVGPEVIAQARGGDWSVVLIGYKPVTRDWFPADLAGADVLCLASGGELAGAGPRGSGRGRDGSGQLAAATEPRRRGRDPRGTGHPHRAR